MRTKDMKETERERGAKDSVSERKVWKREPNTLKDSEGEKNGKIINELVNDRNFEREREKKEKMKHIMVREKENDKEFHTEIEEEKIRIDVVREVERMCVRE